MSLRKLTVTPLVGGALLWGWGVLREALNHSPTVSRIPGGFPSLAPQLARGAEGVAALGPGLATLVTGSHHLPSQCSGLGNRRGRDPACLLRLHLPREGVQVEPQEPDTH